MLRLLRVRGIVLKHIDRRSNSATIGTPTHVSVGWNSAINATVISKSITGGETSRLDGSREPLFGLRTLNLLWALPIAFVLQFAAFFVAKLAWCGLQNCGTRLTGSDPSDIWDAVVYVFVGALLAAFILVVAPWTKQLKVRLIAPPVCTGAVGVLTLVGLALASAM